MPDGLLVIGGLLALAIGGDLLVRGSVAVAERLGMSRLLIGLTLVGFGTSTPELVTSLSAAQLGAPGIAIGNIVGSNIANLTLVLGLVALIAPLPVAATALTRDGVWMAGTAAVFALAGVTVGLPRAVGAVFVAGLVAYIVYAWRQERVSDGGHTAAYDKAVAAEEMRGHGHGPVWLALASAIGGLVLLVVGGKYLVQGAVGLARTSGISEAVIGLTIVAVGTSLPEFVTTLIAAVRGHGEVALGNVLGSNIYNTLGIGGATALLVPAAMPAEIVRFDNLVMVAVSLVLLVMMWTGARVGRREGATLLLAYAVYVATLLRG
jgi:cation:H+ antiporter